MLAHRLLAVGRGGGGGFHPPAIPHPVAVTSSPDGGWTQIIGPHAVWHNGVTYVGWVDSTGNVEVVDRPDGGSTGTVRTIAAAYLDDAHAAPALIVRPSDHKLLVFYSGHFSSDMNVRVSTTSLDTDPDLSDGFAAAVNLDSQLGGTEYTYPSAGIVNGDVFLTYRDRVSGNLSMCMSSSSDGVTGWAAQTQVIFESGVTPYAMVHFGPTRIDLAVSNGNGVGDAHVDVFHLYWDGAWHKTDGTTITSPPFTSSELTLVFDTGTGTGWPGGMAIDSTGAPVIVSESLDSALGSTVTIRYHRWNGSTWDASVISTFSAAGLQFVAHSALDETDPWIVWTAEPVSGVFEIFRNRTGNLGAAWSRDQITSGSSSTGNVYPANIHDRGADLLALWLTGTYHDTVEGDFTLGITAAAA